VISHETIYITWYPFDWTVSPFYELVNISQVIISQRKNKNKNKSTIEGVIYSYILLLTYPSELSDLTYSALFPHDAVDKNLERICNKAHPD
jgi:hypothetical protein